MSSWSGGTSFPNVPSWGSSFNTSLPSSLTSSTSGASGGFGGMLPAIGAIAGANAGASIFGGILGANAEKQIAQAKLNAMSDAAKAANIWNEAFRQDRAGEFVADSRQQDVANLMKYQLGAGELDLGQAGFRSGDYGKQLDFTLGQNELTSKLASAIGERNANFGWGADLAEERGFKRREFDLGRGADKETAITSDRAARERRARNDPETRKAQRFEEELNRRRIAAGQLAAPTGMFGQTAFSSRVFG
jgi:hypothetical protein